VVAALAGHFVVQSWQQLIVQDAGAKMDAAKAQADKEWAWPAHSRSRQATYQPLNSASYAVVMASQTVERYDEVSVLVGGLVAASVTLWMAIMARNQDSSVPQEEG
jgi:hypothetical protein